MGKLSKGKWLAIVLVLLLCFGGVALAAPPEHAGGPGGSVGSPGHAGGSSDKEDETNTTEGEVPCEPEKVVDLIAGQDMVVGSITVTNDDENLCVTYALDENALEAGWLIYETHLAIATEKEGIPQTRGNRWGTNPIPGQFPYGNDELGGVEYYEECILFEDLDFEIGDEVYIAAHAVVKRFDRDMTSATIYGNIGGYTGSGPQGDIYEIDPLTETEDLIFDNPTTDFEANWYPNALAYDEDNKRLYFTTHRDKLVFYDLDKEEVVEDIDPKGIFVNNDNVLGATFGDGYYWYILNRSPNLYRLGFDDNGKVTELKEYVLHPEDSLTQGDIEYRDGMIYGSSGTGAGGWRGFFSYDIEGDEFKALNEYEEGVNGLQLAWGLDEDGNKVLYGCRGIREDGEVTGSEWFTTDLETGEDTPVGFISDNAYQDLASFIDYEETWESETAWGEGERFNERGNWGMYFEYKICEPPPEEEIYPESGTTSVAYEDLPKDDSDWDYNDWVATIETEGTFRSVAGDRYLTKMEFDITPKARGAADNHSFHIVIPAGTFSINGTYELTIFDGSGDPLPDPVTGNFDATTENDFTIWESTLDALPNMSNTGDGQDPVDPSQTAKVSIVFDGDGCDDFDFGDYPETDIGVHGDGLFFEPILINKTKNMEVPFNDIRMLVVPDDWRWPKEQIRIWNAYDAVGEDTGQPTFVDGWWDLGFNEDLVY